MKRHFYSLAFQQHFSAKNYRNRLMYVKVLLWHVTSVLFWDEVWKWNARVFRYRFANKTINACQCRRRPRGCTGLFASFSGR